MKDDLQKKYKEKTWRDAWIKYTRTPTVESQINSSNSDFGWWSNNTSNDTYNPTTWAGQTSQSSTPIIKDTVKKTM